jgi:hypothetical protein
MYWELLATGNIHDIARIFDVFLCSPPEYCLYFCAAVSE